MPEISPERPQFICEPMVPVPGTGLASGAARGEPGLPLRFLWRGRQYAVVGIIRQWKTHGPCRSGADELYLRRHWYEVLTEPHAVLTVYCDRQSKERRHSKRRWWVYSASQGP